MMDQFIDNHLSLLSLEREEELSQGLSVLSTNLKDLHILEDKGICVSKLTVESERVGLFGRRVFTFRNSRQFGTTKLQTNLITSGDIVGVFVNGKSLTEQVTSGVVTRSTENSIEVAFEELPEDINWSDCHGTLQLIKLANDVTYRRLKRALTDVKSHEHVSHHLIDVFFNDGPLAKPHPKWTNLLDKLDAGGIDSSDGFCFVNSSLDSSQKRAVLFALSRPSVAIIHGPPGTGKTTTVIEFILQSVRLKQKILACAPSNVAVDNLVDRLSSSGVNIIRLGHPARMVHSALKYSLDSLIAASDGSDIIMDVREEMNHALAKASKSSNSTERRKWRNEVKLLRKELIAREEKLLKELLCRADVILATNTGASSDGPLKNLPKDHFDVIVIDECAQSLEASCWIPIMKGSKCVLAGDHKQLPPTILSDKAAKGGLSVTLMERLVKLRGDSITTLLTVQYRMNHHIMRWPSEYLYDHLLTAHESVSNHLLKDMPGVGATCVTSCPLFFIDTAGCDISELETTSDESRGNYGEADLVMYHAKDLLDAGVSPLDIAIIAPYNLQVDIIRKKLEDLSVKLDVHTVDSFQGQEKEAVIISFTRSNANGDIGFLKELRRTNVAVTRARRHLALIGDSQTISNEPFIKGLLDYCLHQGETHSAHEYIHYTAVSTTTTISSTTCETGTTDVAITTTEVKENEINKITRQRLYYKERLEHLLESNEETMSTFPSALTSQERKIIHELCEELGLNHVSHGAGPDRYISVSKLLTNDTHTDAETTKDDDSTVVVVQSSPSLPLSAVSDIWKCPVCGYSVPGGNRDMHQLRCEREQRRLETLMNEGRNQSSKMNKRDNNDRVKTKKSDKKKIISPSSDVDLDTLLEEMREKDSRCSYLGCKRKINHHLDIKCQFCSNKFCNSHSLAEVHGCGNEAKKYARRQLEKELRGAAGPPTRAGPERRTHLQRKLEKKIVDLSNDRQRKKPPHS